MDDREFQIGHLAPSDDCSMKLGGRDWRRLAPDGQDEDHCE